MDRQIVLTIVEYRETNLMSLALLFPYLMLNMFRMLIHPSSGACDVTPTHNEPEQYNP